MTITEKFRVSIDWLLTGQGPREIRGPGTAEPTGEYEPMNGWPEEIRQACRQVKTILESNHPVVKPALLSNLAAFQYTIEQEKETKQEVEGLKKRVRHMENLHKTDKEAGTDGAATSNTGKKAM